MKRGREYSLKGTCGLRESKVLKRERKREAEIMNRDEKDRKKGELKQRTNMIGKQTSKQAEWKTQPVFSLVQRFVSACVEFLYLLETNCSTEWASELGSDTQRDKGEARDRAGTLSLWNTRLSHWALFVCLLFYFHPLFIITTTLLSLFSFAKTCDIPSFLFSHSLGGQKWFFSLQSHHVAFSYFVFRVQSDTRTDCVS